MSSQNTLNSIPPRKVTKVGINGFGRIGRMVLRAWLESSPEPSRSPFPDFEIVAINNPLKKGQTIENFLHLLEYDSVHGRFKGSIEVVDGGFKINGMNVKFYSELDPANIPWGDTGVEIVIDSTGVFKDKPGLGKHMHGTVKKVIMTAPGDGLDKTFVVGTNSNEYDHDKHHIISNASCTTNCLAPVVKVLDDVLKIKRGLINTVHSYTNDQRLVDSEHDDLRRARAAAVSIIPSKTGAAKAIGEVLPHLKGKLDGFALRVPTPGVSVVDACFEVEKETTKEEVNELFKKASEGDMKGVLCFSTKELVSVDFVGDSHSSIVDSKYTQVMEKTMVKVLAWYDNEWGYSCRVLDLTTIVARGLNASK